MAGRADPPGGIVDGERLVAYKLRVIEVRQTDAFSRWLDGLRDIKAQLRIAARIRRLQDGNAGDAKSFGGGISEMRVDHGPGYRLYFTYRGTTLVILLCGGDKRTQSADIAKARHMAKDV